MFLSRRETLRDRAAKETLATIRRDRAEAPAQVKPLLAYIEENLFDPDLTVESMKEACGVRGHTVISLFKKTVRLRPSDYFREHRLEVAAQLLRTTTLEVWMVAELAGFGSEQVLGRNFGKSFGCSPSAYRAENAEAAAGEPLSAHSFNSVNLWRRALPGRLAPEQGAALARALGEIYLGEEPNSQTPVKLKIDGRVHERSEAEKIWLQIRDLPRDQQELVVREQVAFSSSALFDVLREKSREEGRRDRQLGVRIAELALTSLVGSAEELGAELPGLRALGWACVGNAHRLALDFPSAEEAFERSAKELLKASCDRALEGEICHLKAAFRNIQRRFEEALDLADQAVGFLDTGENRRILAESLILRAIISAAEGKLEPSIADLTRASELVAPHEKRLRLSIGHNLAAAHVTAEQYERASRLLPAAMEIASTYDEPLIRFHLKWLEGRINMGVGKTAVAEKALASAHEGFLRLGETGYAAVVKQDRANLYSEAGTV
ncbi:MAG: helix-turn-helix domain-containing protein [bacterium]|nr:helix-turn-helix domain-containing protein [bacterium]